MNKIIIAAAGSGKTTHLVNEALKVLKGSVLITTYTQANEAEIRNKLILSARCIPESITVMPWFTFLLRHGVRPYQGILTEQRITGVKLVNGRSGFRYKGRNGPVYYAESDFNHYYFSSQGRIYTDKLSKLVLRCNDAWSGKVIDRLARIYTHIFIDEVQDLSGWDLELLKVLFNSPINITLVGDPRQATYSTSNSAKNRKYAKSAIVDFFDSLGEEVQIDDASLCKNHRSVQQICELSNQLYPDYSHTISSTTLGAYHEGVFIVRHCDVHQYLEQYRPMQLRDSARTKINNNYQVMNFGESKGRTFDRVLLYLTKPMLAWLFDSNNDLPPTSRAKLYVAITRARYSVAIIAETVPEERNVELWMP